MFTETGPGSKIFGGGSHRGRRCYLDFRLLPTKKYRSWGQKRTQNHGFRTPAPMFTKTGPGGLKSLVVGADGMKIVGR